MENLRRIAVFAVAVGALLIPATAASAATRDMSAGTPPKGALKGLPEFVTDTPSIRRR